MYMVNNNSRLYLVFVAVIVVVLYVIRMLNGYTLYGIMLHLSTYVSGVYYIYRFKYSLKPAAG